MERGIIIQDTDTGKFWGKHPYEQDNWTKEPNDALIFKDETELLYTLTRGKEDYIIDDYTKEMYTYSKLSGKTIEIKQVLKIADLDD